VLELKNFKSMFCLQGDTKCTEIYFIFLKGSQDVDLIYENKSVSLTLFRNPQKYRCLKDHVELN